MVAKSPLIGELKSTNYPSFTLSQSNCTLYVAKSMWTPLSSKFCVLLMCFSWFVPDVFVPTKGNLNVAAHKDILDLWLPTSRCWTPLRGSQDKSEGLQDDQQDGKADQGRFSDLGAVGKLSVVQNPKRMSDNSKYFNTFMQTSYKNLIFL